ncbi:DinB family protein [Cohnella sp. AR92]|uniref:DinB family protein n=1 Tax=Cohnella sp. AR92 TaxID=648716 RepID=UPI000F8D1CA9|nr:DinB family protein [Cohnella sp. AR92]RUS46941.1 DinB family protein [Cohnella sp. AR92]
MTHALAKLKELITEVPLKIQAIPEENLTAKPQPNKWSKKEILGHLCDSALVNLQRFVRAQYEPLPYQVLKYEQDQWVDRMNYRALPTAHLLNLWAALNNQIVAVLENISEDKLKNSCDVGEAKIVSLEWLIDDYLEHMEHHLRQI